MCRYIESQEEESLGGQMSLVLNQDYIRRGTEKCLDSGYFFGSSGNRVAMNEMCAVGNKMESRKTPRQPGTVH